MINRFHHKGNHPVFLFVLFLSLLSTAGCKPYRLVIDVTDTNEGLTETTVMKDAGASTFADNKIAMIDITGVIADHRTGSLLSQGYNPLSEFLERLQRAEKDNAVKAVILHINSPGGSVAASETIYRELLRFRKKTGKPIIVSMGEVAASGGYYVALASDEIIAQPSTITGSVGVLIQLVNISKGLNKLGIEAKAVVSGPNKIMGSPLEKESPEHRKLFQEIVNEFYDSFRSKVMKRRPGLKPELADMATDGRVFTGEQAVKIGLVDKTGFLRDAFADAKKAAGLSKARLVKYHRPSRRTGTAYAADTHFNAGNTGGMEVNLLQIRFEEAFSNGSTAGFYYLWSPGLSAE